MKSIGTVLAVQIAIVLTVAMLASGGFQAVQQYRQTQKLLYEKEENVLKPLSLILEKLLFDVEREQIDGILRSYLQSPDILSIKVLEKQRTTSFLSKNPITHELMDLRNETLQAFHYKNAETYERSLKYNNHEIGQLEIIFSRQLIIERTRRSILQAVVNLGMVILLEILAVLWVVRKQVKIPLLNLLQTARQIAEGKILAPPKKMTAQHEIRLVIMAMQEMAAKINEVLDETGRLIDAVQRGELNTRGNIEAFAGGWRELVQGLNLVLDAFIMPFDMSAGTIGQLAQGKVPQKISGEFQGDFNEIKANLNLLIDSTQEVTLLARKISEGNLKVEVKTRSEDDDMMEALANMLSYLLEVAQVAEKISNKELNIKVTPKSEQDLLNRSLRTMVENLHRMVDELEQSVREVQQQNWLKTGLAELDNALREETTPSGQAEQSLLYLANYVQAQVGAIYLTDHAGFLRQADSYAYMHAEGTPRSFAPGEGLVGQAAREKRSMLFREVPEDYMCFGSGLGTTRPRNILVTPFFYKGENKGAIEFGWVGTIDERIIDFLEQSAGNIAIAIHTAQTHVEMQKLLEATQEQAEELQAQQEQLRVANEELENQTKILGQQQAVLEQKNQELEYARREIEEKAEELKISSTYKSEFLANMSHELRTPLNSLLILSTLLSENRDANLNDQQVEFAETIHAAGTDLLELINEVLDLSKVESGKMTLHVEQMSLQSLMEYIRQNFQHVAEDKGLILNIESSGDLPSSLMSDRQRVEQIVKNFMSNALKFTDTGTVTFRIARPDDGTQFSRSDLSPGGTVMISVADTGPGIPKEKQALIFEAFHQADGATDRKFGGTGLGLSISRELARLLGGEIHLQSEAGKGSAFSLYLPEILPSQAENTKAKLFSDSHAPASEVRQPKLKSPEDVETIRDDRHEQSSPTDKYLLIVEDDPKFAKILFELARERGFKGLIAGDGSAGLQLACQYEPVAIILDVGLPDMSGWKVMEKLKKHPDLRHIPVHIITACDNSSDRAIKMGALGYLAKPVTVEALQQVFDTLEQAHARTIRRILLVEDDEKLRTGIQELLDQQDVKLSSIGSGNEAYELLHTQQFDCIILDLGLEDISGLEFLERIRQDAATSNIPVIIYTGKELSEKEEATLKHYSESIIIKGAKSPERLLDEVTLFLHLVEQQLPKTQQKKLRLLHEREDALAGKSILLVDDDMRNLYSLTSMFERNGMAVLTAEDGREALDVLSEHPEVSVVLMDMMMPEMDGYEAIRAIRKQSKFHNLPIISLTAKAMKGDRRQCLDAGANDYLSKPVDMDKLLSLLRVWLY